MKYIQIFVCLLLLLAAVFLVLHPNSQASALPEYSAQTGEPCASCHISPSGGGPRGPRGQAWVASSKPGAVPDLVQSLELLGVELTVDQDYFVAPEEEMPEADPLSTVTWQGQPLYRWLLDYEGN